MKTTGLMKRRRLSSKDTEGARRAEQRLDEREVRSYEAEYVNGLWHWDCHIGSKRVLTAEATWETPILFGVLDDCSRVGCHLQWYLGRERAEIVAHGLMQAFQKRGLPRAGMSDGGSAMMADEVTQGLARLGILHEKTLAYSPYQNGKQETFWAQVEGRLLAMLEGEKKLTLSLLNEATQAWLELEYNRKPHSEIGQSPVSRFLAGPEVTRSCPSSDELRQCFMAEQSRTQRKSDGTISVDGRRFEVPSRYRHLDRVVIRYAQWDLSHLYMVDERSGTVLSRILPLDKMKNASGIRRSLEPPGGVAVSGEAEGGVAPLLRQLMADYAATGLPPAYVPKAETQNPEDVP
jgi:transposase InsO family protein